MIRRLTIACGLLTLAVVFGLVLQDRSLSGARAPHQKGGVQVTAIPDRPAFWPPVKPEPPAPQPQPLHRAAAPASSPRGGAPVATAIQNVVEIANTLFNLPKIIHDQTQAKPSR